MQQVENCGEEEATVDVQFTDLPNALIACKVPEGLFNEGSLKVRTKCCDSVLISVQTLAFYKAACVFVCWMCAELKSFASGFEIYIYICNVM